MYPLCKGDFIFVLLMKSLLLALFTAVSAETILGSFVFVRHGDRLKKPTTYLTPLGVSEEQDAGTYFHNRYFNAYPINGLDEVYQSNQVSVMVADSDVLSKSSQAFVQGLYPPVGSRDASEVPGASLANGTTDETPFNGYQYVYIEGVNIDGPEYWTIDGNTNCPAYTNASAKYYESDEFKALNQSTLDFYQSLSKYTAGSLPNSKLNYGNAYTVFDFFEVNYYHNETFYNIIKDDMAVFNQVRYYQDEYSKSFSYNASNSVVMVSGASILNTAGSFIKSITNTTSPERLSVIFGSYDSFYSMFGLFGWMNLDESKFTGLVDYASALAIELITDDSNNQYVRAGIRNGTNVTQDSPELEFFPVFGNNETTVPVDQFLKGISSVAIANISDWCTICSGTTDTCAKLALTSKVADLEKDNKSSSNLSLADAGGIGAGVTIGVFLILGALGYMLYRILGPKPRNERLKDMELASVNSTVV